MSRVVLFTCLALALIVVCFVAVWLTIPGGQGDVKVSSVNYPAKLLPLGDWGVARSGRRPQARVRC